MEDVYKGIPQLSIYMDDISAMGDETEDHLKTIRSVFERRLHDGYKPRRHPSSSKTASDKCI